MIAFYSVDTHTLQALGEVAERELDLLRISAICRDGMSVINSTGITLVEWWASLRKVLILLFKL